jgi:hypothetical protein
MRIENKDQSQQEKRDAGNLISRERTKVEGGDAHRKGKY